MSLHDQYLEHRAMRDSYARLAVKDLLHGEPDMARWCAEKSAMEAHLAYEADDTLGIVVQAASERLKERGQRANQVDDVT